MKARIAVACLVLAVTVSPVPAGPVADDGFHLDRVRELRISGTVFDTRTGRPLVGAQVAIEGPYRNHRADTGFDGSYLVTAEVDEGLGKVSILYGHADYQQKYLETIFRDAFPGKVEFTVAPGSVRVKGKRLDETLACGGRQEIPLRRGGAATASVVCEDGLTGVSIELHRNRVSILAAEPYRLRIDGGKIEVADSENTSVTMRVDAAMIPR